MSERPTVLLVEDHLAMRKGLELLLRDRGLHVVGVTHAADEGLRMFRARRPDVAILDIALEEGDGVELAEQILAEHPDAGVLVHTGLSDAAALDAAAQCGARGFVLKTIAPAELIKAVRVVAGGGVYVDPDVARLLARSASRAAVLTCREREVLDLLASGLTGEQAAERLFLSPETVRTHIRNAMRKLDARTRAHAIALAVRLREINL